MVCRRLLGLCLRRCSFCLCDPTTWLDRKVAILPSKVTKKDAGKGKIFFRADIVLNTSLLMGQYTNYSGELKLSGHEIKDINIYPFITSVSLESYLFSGSLRDNLVMAKEVSEKEMNAVLERVGILDFVNEQGGLNMRVLEGGKNLSGGQRQRLVLARALLKDSPIYIMDEATSNIDVESENKIMEVLYELSKEKLVLCISHRLANLVNADQIYCLKDGNIVESGNHEELIHQNGVYCELFNTQEELERYGA